MEQRQELLEAPMRYGVTVKEACALYGVSTETFYYWRRRVDADGEAGLENRSTAPHRSPMRIPHQMESQIVDLRRAHPRWGARRIRTELRRKGVDPPARSTIERVLVRNGLRHRSTPKPPPPIRFQRERANELWQMDAKDWDLTDRTTVRIISCLDDCSRLCAAVEAFPELCGEAAISVFDAAAGGIGLPESVLSDRGATFTGRTSHTVSDFERHLWSHGVYTINGRPYHPQTQGKIERYHRTLGEWLEDHGPFATIEELNVSLVEFRRDYNQDRPNQAFADEATPAEVFTRVSTAGPDPQRAAERCRREAIRPTSANGNVSYNDWIIGLGRAWGRTKVRVVDTGALIEVWAADGTLIRALTPDRTKRYLGTGAPRGRPIRM